MFDFAVIEAGGTKFRCAIVNQHRDILVETKIATSTPDKTLNEVIQFFLAQRHAGYNFEQLGLACFGPLDLDPKSAAFGSISSTPKSHWKNIPITAELSKALYCQVYIDTDVNAAALAEYKWGAAQNTDVSIHITVGTGIGEGVVINDNPLHGLVHPEIGHMLVPAPDGIHGVCPFHTNCVEGLASGSSMSQIWGQPAETLADEHLAWSIQGRVLGMLCHNLLVNFSAQRIIFGGGVMGKPSLLNKVIEFTEKSLAGYIHFPQGVDFHKIITLPGLGQESGILGALTLIENKSIT